MKNIFIILLLLVVASLVLNACIKKSETPTPASTPNPSNIKDTDWAVDPDFKGDTNALSKEKNPIDPSTNTLTLNSGYDPGFSNISVVTKGNSTEAFRPIDDLIGRYEVEDQDGIYSISITTRYDQYYDGYYGFITNIERSNIAVPVECPSKNYLFSRGAFGTEYKKISVTPETYMDTDFSLWIVYKINGQQKTIHAYKAWEPQ